MNRWIPARELDESDAEDVKRILLSKLDLPHIRDLARNPMQLAILLSLIHAVGYSLPDERTQLYSSYMDRFLTREADKSPAVRRHRQVLVKVHQHLPWLLQSRAEGASGLTGSITPDELRQVIGAYLVEHEFETSILDELFTGVLERVYVLVQRIEGAYEFEVQPLREYFCATYLYETSKPTERAIDSMQGGTRPQRLDALLRNPYWTNVARFYAGCYTSGELGGLYFQLEELKDEERRPGFRPRHLGSIMLGDWVFRDSPRVTRRVAECVFDDLGLKGASKSFGQSVDVALSLPAQCGREELAERALSALERPHVPIPDMASLLRQNRTDSVLRRACDIAVASTGSERSRWISVAARSGALTALDGAAIDDLISSDKPGQAEMRARVSEIFRFNDSALASSSAGKTLLIEMAITGRLGVGGVTTHVRSWMPALADATSTVMFAAYVRHRGRVARRFRLDAAELERVECPDPRVRAFLLAYAGIDLRQMKEDPLATGSRVIELIETELGDVWAARADAAVLSGVPSSPGQRGEHVKNLHDPSQSVVWRARRARYWSGGPGWWLDQLDSAHSVMDRMFWLLLLVLWAPAKVLNGTLAAAMKIVAALDEEDYENVYSAVSAVGRRGGGRVLGELDGGAMSVIQDSPNLRALFVSGAGRAQAEEVSHLDVDGAASMVRRSARWAQFGSIAGEFETRPTVDGLHRIRAMHAEFLGRWPGRGRAASTALPRAVAEEILREPLLYPWELVRRAESLFAVDGVVVPVAKVAKSQAWSFE